MRLAAALLALALLAAPLGADAQPTGKSTRIGVLCLIACEGFGVDAFRLALQDLGYVHGRTLSFEYRAAERATATIPVVMGAAGDPLRAGIVPSLAKPGGNATGLSSLALELETKRLELLKEVVPNVSRVGVFWDPENPYSALAIKQEEMAARAIGVRLHPVRLRGAPDLENAFAALKRDRVEALSVHGYVATLQHRAAIVAFATANRMAAIYPLREYVSEGGLVSYGANLAEISRRAAHYVDRILKGAKPAELPVEQPTRFQIVVNLKTAKALGLTIPQSVLLRADEVIQ